MSSLKDKNIIVTGASGGIGNSIVEKLNQNGANILATGTRIEKLEELKEKFNNIKILKFDISQHGLDNSPPDLSANIFIHRAQDKFPFEDKVFDLVISLGTLHNLHIYELETALSEVQRVGKSGYIMVESFRNELEMFNLECWALTAETIKDVGEWKWIFDRFGYTGDYEFIFFECIQISKETEAHLVKKIGQFPILHHQQKPQPLCSNTTI